MKKEGGVIMGNQRFISKVVIRLFLLCFVAVLLSEPVCGDWLKMDPPPDVDKYSHGHTDTNSCWMATAANMLAGAGYGDGNDVDERADDIYKEMCIHFDPNSCNWTDTAINWWLGDANNTWDDNPYTVVIVHGRTLERYPWANPELPKLVGNELRKCNFVRLSIRKPTCDADVGVQGGHAIAAWGDDGGINDLNDNPAKVWVTDSDRGNMMVWEESYTYDDYNNPNPGDTDDCNEGVGWYINYKASSHWFIDNIVILGTTDGNGPALTQTVVGSTSVTYNGDDPCATDLHYRFFADANILSYSTTIDWDTDQVPTIIEDDNEIEVTWDLQYDPVPKGTTVKITAEVVLPHDQNDPNVNSIGFKNLYWTPMHLEATPGSLLWGRHTGMPGGHGAYYAPNMCGGYVISAFNIYKEYPVAIYTLLGEYRFQHEHEYYQDPEFHTFFFAPQESEPPEPPGATYVMGNFRFGHSWGLLTDKELWQFSQWRTYELDYPPYPLLQPWTFILDWDGQLPYPQGQLYHAPDECGDPGTDYLQGDINKDCYVDFKDMALLVQGWLGCTDPTDPECPW
jgi:hypothetical protein